MWRRVRDRVVQWGQSTSRAKRLTASGARLIWRAGRFLVDGRYRSERLGPWRFRASYHQTSTRTTTERYPLLFDDCRRLLDDGPHRRLLSFGCSTGEEVESLAARWPLASIVGVDINPWCLARCRRLASPRRAFHHRLSPAFDSLTAFDAIFCLAVFQRPENRQAGVETASHHSFDDFEREIAVLDRKLAVGGLLVIDHSDFRFGDTRCAHRYAAVPTPHSVIRRQRPTYDARNRRIADDTLVPRIFVKQRD